MNSAEKEAIATLNEHLDHWKRLLSEKICDQSEGEKTIDALQNAIKALEQDPCADMVSRDAMWDVLQRLYGTEGELVEELMSLPPVLPMPKMGKWIMSDDGLYRPICNNCGAHPWKGYIPTVEEATEAYKYCPTCGAKMQEVENETNN